MKIHLFTLLLAACLLCTACGKTETPQVTENTTETTTSAEATSAAPESTQTEATLPPASGGTGICGVHAEAYHSYPQPWLDYVGMDAFIAWNQAEHDAHGADENGCPYPTTNAYTFIHTFNYPKERFIEEYNTHPFVDYDYQVDLLYGDDPAAVDAYYREGANWHTAQAEEAMHLRDMKWNLIDKYPDKLRDYVNWKEHSLLEMLEIVGINLSDAQSLTAQDASLNENLPLHFDAVAAMSADEQKELMSEHSAFYQDCVLLGETPYETPYEKQVAVNAAAANPEPPAGGAVFPCSVHDLLYHCFPYSWVEKVGEDAFNTWFTAAGNAQAQDAYGCPCPQQNVYAFIHAFRYPKDVFIGQYNTDITIDWCFQVDLLYGDDPAAAEAYYRTAQVEISKQRKKNEALRTLKWDLLDQYPDKLQSYVNWKEHSLLEMLEIVGINLSDVQAMTAQDASLNEDLPLHFDAVAAMSADEQKELMTEHSAFYQDCVLLGETPYETPYEKQVADNEEAARIRKERGLDLCAQICCAHNLLYHSYFDPWIAYVGADTLEAWSNAEILAHYPSTVECPYPTANVYNFIHTFNYPKERFIEDFNTVLGIEYDYPVDLLYGDDPAAVERYFAELVDRHTKMEEDAERLGDWKYDLRQQYPEQFRDYYNRKQHSLLEMLAAVGTDFSNPKPLNETAAQYGLQLRFDTIAAMDADALTALTAHSAFWQDCVLLGETPYETPYEKQVADNAAQ